jgi:ammonium transporter, Amt family
MPATTLTKTITTAVAVTLFAATAAVADSEPTAAYHTLEGLQEHPLLYPKFMIDNLWVLIAAGLVFLMHLGFSCLEAGLTRQKNTVNVLFKNVFVISIGILTYAFCGFNLMYPGEFNGFLGFAGFGIGIPAGSEFELLTPLGYELDMTMWSDFIFQAMFAATAATIVSGAVAERVKLSSFMILTVLLVAVSYPITGSWLWGEGWLDGLGFYDFAGSTLVHAVGGAAALGCVVMLGPRAGKYPASGGMRPIPGHSMPLATIGVFLLWLGWFGFNGGSVLSADPVAVSFVFVTTALAAAAGAVAAMLFSWGLLKKPDLSMSLNGVLAGLVGITAGADVISPMGATLVGGISGVLVVLAIIFFDRMKIDDPVGAISVHGVCGIWGTLAVGVFSAEHQLWVQAVGAVSIIGFTLLFTVAAFGALKMTLGIRVSGEEEEEGLDLGEHGQEAYPDFGKVMS